MAVRTKSGLVTGLVEDGIEVFRGIPYGAPTALSGRFRPPASPEAWSGERPCRTSASLALNRSWPWLGWR